MFSSIQGFHALGPSEVDRRRATQALTPPRPQNCGHVAFADMTEALDCHPQDPRSWYNVHLNRWEGGILLLALKKQADER